MKKLNEGERKTSAKTKRSSEMRTRILEAVVHLFGENGFEGTSIQSIAESVGIKKQSLLYHFRSKDVLRQEVIGDLISVWTAELPKLLTKDESGYDRFSSTMTSFVEFFLKDRNRARFTIREMLDRPDEISAVVSEHLAPWTKMMFDYIETGKENGIIKQGVHAEEYIKQVMMMVIGTVAVGGAASSILGGDDETLEPKIKELVRIARSTLFVKAKKNQLE